MQGKDKCNTLKAIRKDIAEKNQIDWCETECHHTGPCKGTCPKCEGEVRRLEEELEKKRRAGKTVAIAGVSAAVLMTMTACGPIEAIGTLVGGSGGGGQLDGDVEIVTDDQLTGAIGPEESETEETFEALAGDVMIETDGTITVN